MSGQRGQILRAMNVDKMEVTSSKFIFQIGVSDVKQGRIGYRPSAIILKSYPVDKRLCIYNYLSCYLKRTLQFRGVVKSFFLTLSKPRKQPSRDTFSRWIKLVLQQSGIDIQKYGPGSTRAASVSKAASLGVNVDIILKSGGWQSESTFQKFYNKDITRDNNLVDFVME